MTLAIGLFLLVLVSLLAGNYLSITVAALGLAMLLYGSGGNLIIVGNGIWNGINSYTLTAVPVFIFLGEILAQTGLAKRIYSGLSPLFERLPGGLLQTNIGTCAVFATISGSSMATAAVVGSISYDELTSRGYNRKSVLGSIAAGGTLGVLIPPSLVLIVYGAWQSVSIGKLFLAAVIPGLLVAISFMIYIALISKIGQGVAPAKSERIPIPRALLISMQAWPFIILIFAILGTIFFGLATPTESGALGVVAALVLAAVYRSLSMKAVWTALRSTVSTFASLMLIIMAALMLAQAVSLSGIPRDMVEWVAASGLPPFAVLALMYAVYLVLGCFLGGFEMLLITLPFTFPLVIQLGYDPVWFGVILVILLEVGQLTPPLGVNLFVVTSISRGAVSLGEAAVACIPYWILLLAAVIIFTAFPNIVLFLPQIMG